MYIGRLLITKSDGFIVSCLLDELGNLYTETDSYFAVYILFLLTDDINQ